MPLPWSATPRQGQPPESQESQTMTHPYHQGQPCDPIQLDEPEPLDYWSGETPHVTPVGGWLVICGLILVTLAAVAWRLGRG